MPLTDLASFQMVDIKATGTTALGDALHLLSRCIDTEVAKTTTEQKGGPGSHCHYDRRYTHRRLGESRVDEFRKRKTAMTVACAAGGKADAAA